MPIITLTSDWGYNNHYAGTVKGKILTAIPEATVVDITHGIEPFNIRQTSFVLSNSYKSFPKGSIHIIGVDSEGGTLTPHAIIYADGHYFIGADTGIFSLVAKEIEKIIHIDIIQDSSYFTFSSKDVFAKVAIHIAQGNSIEELGDEHSSVRELIIFPSTIENDIIKGRIIYVDDYGNLITNITETQVKKHVDRLPMRLQFKKDYSVKKIHEAYGDVGEADIVAVYGSSGYVEIAINRGNASQLLGMFVDDPIELYINPQEGDSKENNIFNVFN